MAEDLGGALLSISVSLFLCLSFLSISFSPCSNLLLLFFFLFFLILILIFFKRLVSFYTKRAPKQCFNVVKHYNLSLFNLNMVEFQMVIFPTWQHLLNCQKMLLLLYIVYDIDDDMTLRYIFIFIIFNLNNRVDLF